MKTITVKGVGKASAPVDTVELSFRIWEKNKDYAAALKCASDKVDALERALVRAGFPKEDFQADSFHVNTEYEGVRDPDGEYRNVFAGYVCTYEQRLCFDFDVARLSKALNAVAKSKAQPELNVSFTVKQPELLQAQLLENAAESARTRAEILCRASGMRLGELQTIEYDVAHLSFRSNTMMDVAECAAPMLAGSAKRSMAANFRPQDIDLQDSAVFVWELLPEEA